MFNIHEYERRLELQNTVQRRDKKQQKEHQKTKCKYLDLLLIKFYLSLLQKGMKSCARTTDTE